MEPYLTFDVISVRYKDKGTSLMTSQWRFRPRRPLSLPLRYDLVTLCLYGDLGQVNVKAGILKLRKRFRMSQILFEHGMNSLPLVCFRGYGNSSTFSIAIPRLAFGRPCYNVLQCCVWINYRIPVSKQGVTNNIHHAYIKYDCQHKIYIYIQHAYDNNDWQQMTYSYIHPAYIQYT